MDRLITELKLAPVEAYHHLARVIEDVNAVMGSFFASERMEDDLRWHEERERRLAEKKDAQADETEAHVHEDVEFQEKDDEDIYFAPEKGNVIFASAIDGWGFRVGKFAQLYAQKLGIKEANLRRVLWGDYFIDPKTKKVISYKHLRGRALKPLFVQFVLENIWAVYDSVVINTYAHHRIMRNTYSPAQYRNPDKVEKIVKTLSLKILPRDLRSNDTRNLLQLIFTQWLSLSTGIIQAAIDIVPPPSVAQATRIPKMLYPELRDNTLPPKNKSEEDLYASKSGPEAYVAGYVSKMFAVTAKDLPENKKKAVTAEEMRARAREARAAREAATQNGGDAPTPQLLSREASGTPADGPTDEDNEKAKNVEVILGFARLHSGTLHVGNSVYAVLPKYNTALDATHPHNTRYLLKAQVEGLYVMMGRDLIAVDSVRAGNIFAIRGLEGKVWRSATICAMGEGNKVDIDDVRVVQPCLVNFGAINRAVCVRGRFSHIFTDSL